MENNIKKYELMQDGRKYILCSEIYKNKLRITCVEVNIKNPPIFIGFFSLSSLRRLNSFFNTTLTIQDAQNAINETIEQQKVIIRNENGSINVLLFLLNQNENATFTLKPNSNMPVDISFSPPRYLPVRKVFHPPIFIKRPTIYTNVNNDYMNDMQQTKKTYIPQVTKKEKFSSVKFPQEEVNNLTYQQDILDILNNENHISQNNNYNYAPIGSPKREQIEYTIPVSQSQPVFNYSAVTSHKNKNLFPLNVTEKVISDNSNTFDTQKIIELQNETNKIKGEHELLKLKTHKLVEQILQLNNQIQILNEENKNLRKNNGAIPNENQIHEITILKQELERISKELYNVQNEKNNEIEEYKKIKEKQIEELTKNINLLLNENNTLKLQIQELLNNNKIPLSEYQHMLKSHNDYDQLIQEGNLEIVKGEILENNDELEFLTKKICSKNKKLILNILYKATVDSDRASAFHNKCDLAKSTIVLIKSGNGKRFGGFTSCDWSGESIDKKDNNAFIFSLDKMKIYDIIPGENAIGCYTKLGPVFSGCQIKINDEAFIKGGTTFLKGVNYDTQEDYELTDGLEKFEVKEIEVYSVNLE